jgi:chemotaxis protein CheX
MDGNGIIEGVMKASEAVFKSMVFMDVKGKEYKGEIAIPDKHLTAMVGFAGSYMGLAAIHCSENFARRIGASMLSMDPEKLSEEDVRDALGEIANMISGHFKARLAETINAQEEVFEQSVPSVICGEDYETHAVTDAPTYCTMFVTDHENFYVELALKED